MRMHGLGALAAAALLTSGCGFANPFAPATAAARPNAEELALKWAECMRQHGVNVSDPSSNGTVRINLDNPAGNGSGGGNGATGSASGNGAGGGGTATSTGGGPPPEVQIAMDACSQYQPIGGTSSGPPSQEQVDDATRFAQCMRDHGVPMPDPQASGGGVKIQAGSQGAPDPNSDQFKQAEQACEQYMPSGMKQKTTVSGP